MARKSTAHCNTWPELTPAYKVQHVTIFYDLARNENCDCRPPPSPHQVKDFPHTVPCGLKCLFRIFFVTSVNKLRQDLPPLFTLLECVLPHYSLSGRYFTNRCAFVTRSGNQINSSMEANQLPFPSFVSASHAQWRIGGNLLPFMNE